ncbi:NADH-quinone oxidoreductase subunit J [Candidatus Bathyarchaeota archaeon]|nr:MAG: NADH-quinone oxidoreductase subunit J [Candidatus Bathyarchaeota archaeon]RLI03914.1 MAG: short chain dehydrogenase [Candidatus Bathyarchaeota archaeon]RLI05264.1 MAG: short chain dehydrogenase [Candidatus Bathyarchaeota archaeon]
MIDLLLIIAAVFLAALSVELKNLLQASVCLFGMCVILGLIFGLLNATYVMVFQFLIYAGATMVLFISVVMLTRREKE